MADAKEKLARAFSPTNVLLAGILGVGIPGGLSGNSKLGESLEIARETRSNVTKLEASVEKLTNGFTELKTRVEASEKLELDRRLRAIEQLGTERRLEVLERELATGGRK